MVWHPMNTTTPQHFLYAYKHVECFAVSNLRAPAKKTCRYVLLAYNGKAV